MPNILVHCLRLALFVESSAADVSPIFYLRTKEDETVRNIVFSSNTKQLTKSINPLFRSSK
jgi:hypothetical protein